MPCGRSRAVCLLPLCGRSWGRAQSRELACNRVECICIAVARGLKCRLDPLQPWVISGDQLVVHMRHAKGMGIDRPIGRVAYGPIAHVV